MESNFAGPVGISMSRCSRAESYQLPVQDGIMTERADNYHDTLAVPRPVTEHRDIESNFAGEHLYVTMLQDIPTPSPRWDHDSAC